jgi:AraC-like DNA-binding protein
MKKSAGDLFIEPVDGVALIYVSTGVGAAAKAFLFDQPVRLFAGTLFSIIPYGCDFEYVSFANAPVTRVAMDIKITSQGVMPQIRVVKLYTVLYQEKGKGFVFKGERHPYWELTYIDKGAMACTVDGQDYQMKQGNLMFFAGGQHHTQRADNRSLVSFFTVTFDVDFPGKDILTNRVFTVDAQMHNLVRDMLLEYKQGTVYSEEMVVCYLTQLIIKAVRTLSGHHATIGGVSSALSSNIKNKLVADCLRIIDEDIGDELTLPNLARRLCISTSFLSKVFKAETGQNISAYIRARRLELAKDLIREGKYSISQISDMLGFCSVSYFSTTFKEKYGFSPNEFSKSAGGM